MNRKKSQSEGRETHIMANGLLSPLKKDEKLIFFKQFLKHPLQIGSVIPSSPYLERRVLEMAEVHKCTTVVELGSGTGGTTKAILACMPQDATLLSIEINPRFHNIVRTIGDKRLIAHLGSAADLGAILDHYGLPNPDAIISGIPFSTMPEKLGKDIVFEIARCLAHGGRFVAYQFSSKVSQLCNPVLGPCRKSMEILNIPPMRVYRWEKNGFKPTR